MSDDLHPILQLHVERAVGRLDARAGRKSLMREELTAHLSGIYVQERERGVEEGAALDAAIRRFGDCDELAMELEASVPTLERVLVMLFSKERLMWRLLVLIGLFALLFGTGLVLPALAQFKHLGTDGRPIVGLMIGVVIVVSGVHLLGWGIVRKLRRAT